MRLLDRDGEVTYTMKFWPPREPFYEIFKILVILVGCVIFFGAIGTLLRHSNHFGEPQRERPALLRCDAGIAFAQVSSSLTRVPEWDQWCPDG